VAPPERIRDWRSPERLHLSRHRIRTALAVYCLVAWRLLFLIYAAREQPEQPCTIFLTEPEWQALYARTHRTREVPANPPDVRTAVHWIAKLDGFLGRKSDGIPRIPAGLVRSTPSDRVASALKAPTVY
jgi:hypothetical protein